MAIGSTKKMKKHAMEGAAGLSMEALTKKKYTTEARKEGRKKKTKKEAMVSLIDLENHFVAECSNEEEEERKIGRRPLSLTEEGNIQNKNSGEERQKRMERKQQRR